jgi:hypothetical protein
MTAATEIYYAPPVIIPAQPGFWAVDLCAPDGADLAAVDMWDVERWDVPVIAWVCELAMDGPKINPYAGDLSGAWGRALTPNGLIGQDEFLLCPNGLWHEPGGLWLRDEREVRQHWLIVEARRRMQAAERRLKAVE